MTEDVAAAGERRGIALAPEILEQPRRSLDVREPLPARIPVPVLLDAGTWRRRAVLPDMETPAKRISRPSVG
jgi:hypothetical protein